MLLRCISFSFDAKQGAAALWEATQAEQARWKHLRQEWIRHGYTLFNGDDEQYGVFPLLVRDRMIGGHQAVHAGPGTASAPLPSFTVVCAHAECPSVQTTETAGEARV
ncbi:hypothetical protein [Variovorax saccharolyticus]|uniref:hypothetical protein n=1 Tax=Variovorax saccharolyticus TaxID=3053516 RepID=UPI0025790FCA|nr:hypothetical protein [Variovorax sp. J22R187]